MKSHKIISRIAGSFAGIAFLVSFIPSGEESFKEKVLEYFSAQKLLAQEKLYLHLDKPYYAAGDNIFFKGYLVDAITHSPAGIPTNFIYVELADRKDSVLVRRKVRRDTVSGFRGNIRIAPEIPEGDYSIRAYTEWMRNADPDFFFFRNIRIGNSILERVRANISFKTEEDGTAQAEIHFIDPEGEPLPKAKIHYAITNKYNRNQKFGTQSTNNNGKINIRLPQQDTSIVSPRIELHLTDDKYDSRYTFFIPTLTEDYHISFFPEGGNLTQGVAQVIAFKGQNANGHAEETEGWIVNGKGDTLTRFKSEHDGMGTFVLKADKAEHYKAHTISSAGLEKIFDLPPVGEAPFALKLNNTGSRILYNIVPAATAETTEDTVYLIAHTRGEVVLAHTITPKNYSGSISSNLFREGISHFLLVGSQGTPIAERLIFIRRPEGEKWKISTDKENYGRREKVTMQISVTDSTGLPVKGNFSVSITDNRLIKTDSLADNIVSNLLLTSDLKGYIENPGYYFEDGGTAPIRHLDLVMLTHGWRRFRIENIHKLPSINVSYYKERGQVITGQVLNPLNNGAKNASVSLTTLDNSVLAHTQTDETGHFLIDSIQFRDTTLFLIQGNTRRGSDVVTVDVDREQFPNTGNKNLFPEYDRPVEMREYLQQIQEKYFTEGGTPVYELKEVVVTAKKDEELTSNYSGVASYIMAPEKFIRPGINTAFDAVCLLPGVFGNSEGKLSIRNETPMLLIDEAQYDDASVLKDIQATDVKSIEVLKGATTSIITFGNTSGGVIMVKLKAGHIQRAEKSPGFRYFTALGYHESVEFYNPVYDTPDKKASPDPDARSTIFWTPSVWSDDNGNINAAFYTSDHPGDYHIKIEGLDKNGKIYYYSGNI